MQLRLDDVARMRLISQRLIDPMPTVVGAARHLACSQGQDHPGSMISLALRTRERSLVQVRAAYDAGDIVRAWPMRGTLFVVAAEDLDWIGSLTRDKTCRATARRREQLGLTDDVLGRAQAVAREALAGGGLTRAEMLARWNDAGIDTDDGRGYHHLFHLAVGGVICLGPTTGATAEQRFVLTEEWIPAPRRLDRDEAIRELLTRYVTSRGPVPLDDFCWWSKLGKTEARRHLAEVSGSLACADVDGREFWMAPDLPDRYAQDKRRTTAPLLLPGFDEIVLGYGDRSAVLTKDEETLVVPGGNGMFKGTVIHRGHAVGTWKKATRKNAPVDVTPFGVLPAGVVSALPRLTAALPAPAASRASGQ